MWRWGCLSAPPPSAGTLLLWHFLGSGLFDYSDCDGSFGPQVCFKSHQGDCLSKDQSIMWKAPYYAKFTMPIFANNTRCPWLIGGEAILHFFFLRVLRPLVLCDVTKSSDTTYSTGCPLTTSCTFCPCKRSIIPGRLLQMQAGDRLFLWITIWKGLIWACLALAYIMQKCQLYSICMLAWYNLIVFRLCYNNYCRYAFVMYRCQK